MWFLPLLFSSQIILSWTLPAPDVFRGQNGVNLDGRKKAHGEGEKCPTERPGYCTCKTRGDGLDITCQDVNSNQLDYYARLLKKNSVEHSIRYFKIRNSNIPKLDDHLFMGMKIEHLYIHDCKMKTLGPNSISSQGNTLKSLVLSNNRLTEVPTNAIRPLKNLENLNLNENSISVLRDEAFEGLSKVTRLSLYHNQITRIQPRAFDGIKRDLQRLNLGKNGLTAVPHMALASLTYLERLDLFENELTELKSGDFNGLDNLDQLVLNNNQLTHIGENYFSGLPKLTTLYIDNNKIRTIHHKAFVGLEAKLESLTLTGNLIEDFPSTALRPVHELQTLHLDDNEISTIEEDAFEGFGEHIKFLWLQNNQIKDIPPSAFQDLHSLEWIKLYNNVLRTLHYELMEPVLDTLQHIDIHSNPLVCDCELRWYKSWIDEEWNPVEEEWLKETFCEDPRDNKQHNIAEVPLKDMYCTSDVRDKPSAKDDDGGASSITTNWLLLSVLSFYGIVLNSRKDLVIL